MGSCLSIEVKLCDVHLHLEGIGNSCCSRSNIQILRQKMEELRALKGGVVAEIQRKRNSQVEVSTDMKTWVENAGKLEKKVSRIIAFRQYLCCEFGIRSKIGCVEEMIKQKPNWKDSIFIEKPKCLPANVVGMEQVMSQVLQYLNDENVGVIGIHGMGGAGKTTLAKQLIKILSSSSSPSTSAAKRGQESVNFDNRIWVTVSQNLDIGKLQKEIAVQLGIHKRSEFKDEEDESIRARFISRCLSERRFLLVLDDVWKQFDLASIGIPEFQEDLGNKIVITTREVKVCTDMGARDENIVKVGCLGWEESWELFQKTIKWEVDKFKAIDVYEIAQDIAYNCGGLPLVIVTIAKAMATKSDKDSWKYVKDELKVSPNEIRGMEEVYKLLQISYSHLEKEEYKSCLLYSALFREDEEISIERMVDYCIGGGSVSIASGSSSSNSISRDISQLRGRGKFIIRELMDACLLERGKDEEHVRVHDAIRGMILNWIGRQNSGSRIVSYAGKDLRGIHYVDVKELRDASMLSFSHNKDLQSLIIKGEEEDHGKSTAQCSGKVDKIPFQANNLQVLLLHGSGLFRGSYVDKLPVECLFCPTLRVLDLAGTGLQEIPLSLCSLKLLQYLNLSFTFIKALPKEMGKLRDLLQLDLSYTGYLEEIPNGLFSSLSKLQSLDLCDCSFFSSHDIKALPILKEIGHLHLLQNIRLVLVGDVDAVKFIVDEYSLSNSITDLFIAEVDIFRDDLFKRMRSRLKKLQWLLIEDGDCKEDLVIDDGHFSELNKLWIRNVGSLGQIILKGQALKDLTCLEIVRCNKLRTLACLWKLPNLKNLYIGHCPQIVELIDPSQSEGDEISNDQDILPKLESLELTSCPNLLRLSSSLVQLHSLKSLYFSGLTCLKDISTINSPHEVEIRCEWKWWKDLQWEGLKPPNFKPIFGY